MIAWSNSSLFVPSGTGIFDSLRAWWRDERVRVVKGMYFSVFVLVEGHGKGYCAYAWN